MTSRIKELIAKLEQSIGRRSFVNTQNKVSDELEDSKDGFLAVEPILQLMESHTNVDFGMPGPLVHFLETFYKKGYEDKLLESLRRKHTPHTVWMLNRILNEAKVKARTKYLKALDEVIARSDADEEAQNSASEFRKLH